MKKTSKDTSELNLVLLKKQKKLNSSIKKELALLKNEIDQHFENFNQKFKIEKEP